MARFDATVLADNSDRDPDPEIDTEYLLQADTYQLKKRPVHFDKSPDFYFAAFLDMVPLLASSG